MVSLEYLLIRNPTPLIVGEYASDLQKLGRKYDNVLAVEYDLLKHITDYHALVLTIENSERYQTHHAIAYATLFHSESLWELSSTYVEQKKRGLGIAGKMMDVLIQTAREDSALVLVTTVGNKYASTIIHMLITRGLQQSNSNYQGDFYLRL